MKKIIFFILVFFLGGNSLQAKAPSLSIDVVHFGKTAIKKGFTIDKYQGEFKIGIFPGVLEKETNVVLKKFYEPEKILPIPQDKKAVSYIYEYDIVNKKAYLEKKPLILEMKYKDDYVGQRSIYFWDKNKSAWVKVPSYDLAGRGRIRAKFYLPYARFIVLEDKNVMTTGEASWYKWKNCDCAASPDYPKGTRLKVTNLENGKSVIVTVNDYGPERDKFPQRIIDLDKVAFQKIADLRQGICQVRVEPVKTDKVIATATFLKKQDSPVEFTKKEVALPSFPVHAQSVIVLDPKTNQIIYEKNPRTKRPIASITKLMTAQVLLDLKIPWDKVMTYSSYDDDVFRYAKRWEMAYLYVSPGEKMTVRDLFFSMLVGSANNAAYTLARSTGLLRRDFVEVMNRTAQELGMKDTHFVEPSGLSPQDVSTAYDLAILGKKVFGSLKILQASTSKRYYFKTINTHKPHLIRNRNKLLWADIYVLGTKTGYLEEAGRCLIVKADDRKGHEIIVVALGNFSKNKSDYFQETENLVKWGLEQVKDN